MSISATHVRDVRDDVRAFVRAFRLVAVSVCGTCGTFSAHVCGRARAHMRSHHMRVSRAYRCPHVPHVPHSACAAGDSRIFTSARPPAHPTHPLARAFSSVTALLKKMDGEAVYGF